MESQYGQIPQTADDMRKMLDSNYKNIVEAFTYQSQENYDQSLNLIMKSMNILDPMIKIADSQQPHTQMILKEHREI